MIERQTADVSPLVDTDQLRELMISGSATVLDVRWRLDRSSGHEEYLAGHIPGALFADLPTQLAGTGEPTDGRHPLPEIADFEHSVRSWGITPNSAVVVYDDWGSQAAARAWWMLTACGISDVRVLDGGLSAWVSSGGALSPGEEASAATSITLEGYGSPLLSAEEAAVVARSEVLLDARAGQRYRGETEPVDPVAGHIPGALNAPTGENLAASGRFLPMEVLRERFQKLGITPTTTVGVYCGSGVSASHEILALKIAGFDAALYPGSWSQWSNHPQLPVATGAEPG